MFVKVCGITRPEQIDWAIELGYSAAGIVLHLESARYCEMSRAADLARYARGRIATVAVGLTLSEVAHVADDFDLVQIYEYQNRERVICAGDSEHIAHDSTLFMYDSSRGSGRIGTLPAWLHDVRWKLIISGGLTPLNVGGIVREYRPFGVDVSSAVETAPGVKDYKQMKQFMSEVTNATR